MDHPPWNQSDVLSPSFHSGSTQSQEHLQHIPPITQTGIENIENINRLPKRNRLPNRLLNRLPDRRKKRTTGIFDKFNQAALETQSTP